MHPPLYRMLACTFIFVAQTTMAQLQYMRISVDQGLSNPAAVAVFRDYQGFLWVGTFDGLNRWDGYTMKVYRNDPKDSTSLPSNSVTSITEDASHELILTCNDGTTCRYNRTQDNFSVVVKHNSRSSSNVVAGNLHSTYWASSPDIIQQFDAAGKQLREFSLKDSLAHGYCMRWVDALLTRNDTMVYAFGAPGFCRYRGKGQFQHILLSSKRDNTIVATQKNELRGATFAPDGSIWIITLFGLCHYDPSTADIEWYKVPMLTSKLELDAQDLRSICYAADGSLWIATWNGLFRFDPKVKTFSSYTHHVSENSISSDNIYSVYVDAQGIVWGGTWGGGLFGILSTNHFQVYRQNADVTAGPPGNNIFSFWEDADDNLLVGAFDAGISYYNRKKRTFSDVHFPAHSAWKINTDVNNDLLFFSEKQGIYKKVGKSFRRMKDPKHPERVVQTASNVVFDEFVYDSREESAIRCTVPDDFDTVIGHYNNLGTAQLERWMFSKTAGIIRYNMLKDQYRTFSYNKRDSADLAKSSSFLIKMNENELLCLCGKDTLKCVIINAATGEYVMKATSMPLQKRVIRNAVFDKHGALWIGTDRGLVRLNMSNGEYKIFTRDDGLPSSYFNHQGAAYCGRSGRLYFGTPEGYVEFFPDSIHENNYKPVVALTRFRRDDKDIVLDSSISAKRYIVIPYNENRFSIEFAALNFLAPQKNTYKYVLEGYDSDWIESGTRREVFYTNLSPGTYTFRVRAANNDGIWSDKEASVVIHVKPPWWRTLWAYLSYACIVVTGFVSIRRADIKRQQKKLIDEQRARENAIIKEKNAQLEVERAKSDSLLLNVLPASIADRLKAGEQNIADHYESVSILFADIVGFTPLAARKTPHEMVRILNVLFKRFDRLTIEHGVERVKTIGDAYMVVAGAPTPCEDHALRMARFAFALLTESQKFSAEINESIVIRIGVNAGEAVGAVIGELKFAYDLWSDAVNTASRMESHGEPGRIHCTADFVQLLQQTNTSYTFENRGPIEIKGKGVMQTFYLLQAAED